MPDRRRPIFRVKAINAKDLNGKSGYLDHVTEVVLTEPTEEAEHPAPTKTGKPSKKKPKHVNVEVKISAANPELLDDKNYGKGLLLSVEFGYEDDMVHMGNYLITRPRTDFPETGHVSLVLKGDYFNSKVMDTTHVRASFDNLTYSEIAHKIAQINGLGTTYVTKDKNGNTKILPSITETKQKYDRVIIANETYLEFLNILARKHGFIVRASNDTLFFCPPMNVPAMVNDVPITLVYNKDGNGTLRSFSVKEKDNTAVTHSFTGDDPNTGKGYTGTGDPIKPVIPVPSVSGGKRGQKVVAPVATTTTRGQQAGFRKPTKKAASSATTVAPKKAAPKPTDVDTSGASQYNTLMGKTAQAESALNAAPSVSHSGGMGGGVDSKGSAEDSANAQSKASSDSIVGTAHVSVGIPQLRKDNIVTLAGIGKYSGTYIIASTVHTMNESGYDLVFDVRTDEIGDGSDGKGTSSPASRENKDTTGGGVRNTTTQKTDKTTNVVTPTKTTTTRSLAGGTR